MVCVLKPALSFMSPHTCGIIEASDRTFLADGSGDKQAARYMLPLDGFPSALALRQDVRSWKRCTSSKNLRA